MHPSDTRKTLAALVLGLCLLPAGLAQQKPEPADLILLNATVWTAEPSAPLAEAVAIRGHRIVKVGSTADVRALASEKTRILDLKSKLVLPGFIDNHTHFASAGRLLLGLNLLEVNEPDAFAREVAAAAKRLPAGAWLLGGDWGAYAAWAKSSAGHDGSKGEKEFEPDKPLIDAVTGDHPALISRFDQQVFLANSLALKTAGVTRDTPDPEGGSIAHGADGEPTGLLRGTAVQLIRKVIPKPSHAQRRAEALRALEEAR